MAKEEEAKDDAEAKGGGKKKLIIIIVPIVLLLAGAGWFFFLKPKDDSGVPKALPEPVPGAVVKLDSITVNLAGGHFLKFGMALQPTATAKEVDGSKALDLAIGEFSQMTLAELSSAEGRLKAKEELVARIKLTYVPEGTDLATVTSLAATVEEQAKDEAKAKVDAEAKTAKGEAKEEIHIEKLSAADVIKMAESLTVQADVYDLYFTEFVMQ